MLNGLSSLFTDRKVASAFRSAYWTCLVSWLMVVGTLESATPERPDAYYDFRKWSCQIRGSKARVTSHNRITINHKRGEEHAFLAFFENRFIRIKQIAITVEDTEGQVIGTYGKEDLTKSHGFDNSSAVYSDICQYYLSPTSPGYPYTIEYELERELKSLFFLRGPTVACDIPVRNMECRIEYPTDMKLHYKTYGLDLSVQETITGNRRVLNWSDTDIPAFDTDTLSELACSGAGEIRMVVDKFTFAGEEFSGCSWHNIGKWYASISRRRYTHRMSIDDVTDIPHREALDRMKQVYDNICGKTRYVSVSIGVSGWRPRTAKETAKTGYGDCKDMSTLLISDLALQGVRAFPVLILTRDEGSIDTSFPSFEFNHVVVAVPLGSDTVWMDPTCRWCPFGELPRMDEASTALLVTDTGGVLVSTPRTSAEQNKTVRKVRITVEPSGRLSATGHISAVGELARFIRGTLCHLSRQEIREYLERLLSCGSTRVSVQRALITNPDDKYEPVQIEFQARSTTAVPLMNGVALFDPILFPIGIGFDQTDTVGRIRPIEISYPRTVFDSITIVIDPALKVDSVKVPNRAQTVYPFGTRSLVAWGDADSSVIELVHSYEDYGVLPEDFDDLLSFEVLLKRRSDHYVQVFSSKSRW